MKKEPVGHCPSCHYPVERIDMQQTTHFQGEIVDVWEGAAYVCRTPNCWRQYRQMPQEELLCDLADDDRINPPGIVMGVYCPS